MTTKLTRAEALRALADGKKIAHENWRTAWIVLSPDRGFVDRLGDEVQCGFYDDGYLIFEDEPNTELQATTLEEALKAENLRIEWPDWIGKNHLNLTKNDLICDFWGNHEITLIHAALSLPGARVVVEE